MMTADDRLALIRIKVERANQHLAELKKGLASGMADQLHAVTMESDTKSLYESGPFFILDSTIPAIVGDIVHNLRSALDHLAWQLVSVGVANGETRSQGWEKIQFPIAHSFDSFVSMKGRAIEGARREAIKVLDRLKPYQGGNDALWLLRQLDNTDKHSFILPVGKLYILRAKGASVWFQAQKPFFTSLGIAQENQDVDFASKEPIPVFRIGGENALLPTLHQLFKAVANIVTEFRPFLE
jgi:hypothetical protein